MIIDMYRRKRTQTRYMIMKSISKMLNIIDMKPQVNYSFCLDPCARVNCNYGRCEVDRSRAACRCYQGYSGSDCLTPLGEFY